MAGDWIKMEAATPDKPEVWQMADDLDIDPDAVVGKLFRVWLWFDQHTENGNAPNVTCSLLDRSVGVKGFCEAMIKAGWMHRDDDHVSLPNFERHNGKTAKNRALTAKRVSRHKRKSNDPGNGEVTRDALPREEKRREEKNEEETNGDDGSSRSNRLPDCPHMEILDLWAEIMPDKRQPSRNLWPGSKRERNLAARWKAGFKIKHDVTGEPLYHDRESGLDWWRRFFSYLRKSGWLMEQHFVDLEWITTKRWFDNILESKYHDQGGS